MLQWKLVDYSKCGHLLKGKLGLVVNLLFNPMPLTSTVVLTFIGNLIGKDLLLSKNHMQPDDKDKCGSVNYRFLKKI